MSLHTFPQSLFSTWGVSPTAESVKKDVSRSLGPVAPGSFSSGEVTVPLRCVESRPNVLRLPRNNGSVERRGPTLLV